MRSALRALLAYVLGILALVGAGFVYEVAGVGAAVAWVVVLAAVAILLVRRQRQVR